MLQRLFVRSLLFMVLLVFPAVASAANTPSGTIVFVQENFYVVETDRSYSVMEWYQEKDPEEGDVVSGILDQPGLQKLYNETAKRELKVWIYDYWLTEEKAHQLLKERGVKKWKTPFRHF